MSWLCRARIRRLKAAAGRDTPLSVCARTTEKVKVSALFRVQGLGRMCGVQGSAVQCAGFWGVERLRQASRGFAEKPQSLSARKKVKNIKNKELRNSHLLAEGFRV